MFFEKLSRRFVRNKRDTAIYSVTVMLAVAIFYSFNATSSQDVLSMISGHWSDRLFSYRVIFNIISVVVTIVIAVLIMYANRFLLKRRQREIGLYLILGMSYRRIASRFGFEVILTNVVSVFIGLLLGVFGSQWLSLFFIRRFDTTLERFRFVFSADALIRTLITFFLITLVVLFFMALQIRRMNLIDLINPGRLVRHLPTRRSYRYLFVLLLAVVSLAFAYRASRIAAENFGSSFQIQLPLAILLGVLGTFLLMYSIAGGLIRLISQFKGFYFKHLRFTILRQFHGRMADFWVSLSVVTILLFFALSGLTFGAAISSVAKIDEKQQKERYAADIGGSILLIDYPDDRQEPTSVLVDQFQDFRDKTDNWVKQALFPIVRQDDQAYAVAYRTWRSDEIVNTVLVAPDGTAAAFKNDKIVDEVMKQFGGMRYPSFRIVKRSDAANLLAYQANLDDPLKDVPSDQSILFRNQAAADDLAINQLFMRLKEGHYAIRLTDPSEGEADVKSKNAGSPSISLNWSDAVPGLYTQLFGAYQRPGFTLFVSDKDWDLLEASAETKPLLGVAFSYNIDVPEDDRSYLEHYRLLSSGSDVDHKGIRATSEVITDDKVLSTYSFTSETYNVLDLIQSSTLTEVMMSFLVIYLGSIFLIATASVLALQHLTEISDNKRRYRLMEKLGVSKRQIMGQVLAQTTIYFLLPLLVALFHSIFSRRMIELMMNGLKIESDLGTMLPAVLIVLILYGGYYVITSLLGVRIAFERESKEN